MTYTLTITENQARTLSQACEVLARLGIGQFRDALEWLPIDAKSRGWGDDMDAIGRILSRHMIVNIDGYRSNLGMHHVSVSMEPQIAWDLYQVIRHRLAWDRAIAEGTVKPGEPRKWPEMMQVHFDTPSKVSAEPLARMEVKG